MAERFTAGAGVWRIEQGWKRNDKFLPLVFLFFTSLFNQAVKIHVHPVCCRRYQAAFSHPLYYFLPPTGPKVSGMILRYWDFVFGELLPKHLMLQKPLDTRVALGALRHICSPAH